MQKYLNKLGWRKISTRFCQFVSNKNRIERVIYCNLCKTHKELFKFSIFLDECIVAMDKNGKFQWYKKGLKGETRSGLQAKYKHAASVIDIFFLFTSIYFHLPQVIYILNFI